MKKIILLIIVLGICLIFLPQAWATLDEGLVGYWPFNGNADDESGNGNHGTVHGSTLTEDRFGNANSAYSFDGGDDYIEVIRPFSFSELTFSVWLKIPDVSINNNRIFTIDEGGGHYYALQGNSANALSLVIDGEEVNEYDWSFLPNTWTHIAMTFDGHTLKVYKDGVMTESGVIDSDSISGPLFIGGVPAPDYGAQIWDGEIDDVRIYNRILSEYEIKMLFSLVQNPLNGHYYQLAEVNSGVNWYEARDAAEAMEYNKMQGHLATVTSAQEDNYLANNFPRIKPEYVWLGATDEASEGDWQWITGEPWNYTNWDPGPGEPNGGTYENCLDYDDGIIKWNDASCGRKYNFYLIEYEYENQPPEAICQDVTEPTESELCTANASVDDGFFDRDGDEITLEQTPPGPYDLGDTEVTLTVTDDKGASDTCEATVTVVDEEDPVISSVTAYPNKLWPPNHKLVPVTVAVDASDNCDLACEIISVESNEPVNGLGYGNTAPDWEIEITGGLTVKLRAERSGKGSGRVYSIEVECADSSENIATDTATVTVPHDKGDKNNQKNKKKK